MLLLTAAFLIIDKNGIIIKADGDVDKQISPMSTFKIAIAAMAYDDGLLKNKEEPKIPWNEKYRKHLGGFVPDVWKEDCTPEKWMQYSFVWYSQLLTQR